MHVTSKYSEYEVLKQLTRKQSLGINNMTQVITIKQPSEGAPSDIGIKTKGKLDYLKHYCGWTIVHQ